MIVYFILSSCFLVRVLSYNPTGLISEVKREYVKNLLDSYDIDILFLQETWLSSERECLLSAVHSNYMFSAQSGMDSRSHLCVGRPHGGVAIMWKKIYI